MKARTAPSFWRLYHTLPASVQAPARRACALFMADPDHPSLRFKKLNGPGERWSVRLGGEYRAVCQRDGAEVTWFWIGTCHSFGKDF